MTVDRKPDCPTEDQLAEYLLGTTNPDEAVSIGAHIDHCSACQQWVQDVRADEALLEEMRQAVSPLGEQEPAGAPRGTNEEDVGPPMSAPDLVIPQPVEGYRILKEIGRGGMGVVYKAYQESTKRVVALKVLLEGPFAGPASRRRFEREVELAASLNHPNIVTVYDSGLSRGYYYFAMDLIDGQPLDRYVRAADLGLRGLLQLFTTICAGVSFAHQRGVIHRDLKPSNILVDAEGRPHIVDFGLAKLAEDVDMRSRRAATASHPGEIAGTLAYMSPEQASGIPGSVDVRTDVYALGVVLYQLVTGTFPYDVRGSTLAILRNIQEVEPARPSRISPRCDRDVEAIALKALSKDPDGRYQSAAEFKHDLDCWLMGLPIVARSTSSVYLLRKLVARHRYAATVLGSLSLIVLGSGLISCDFYLQARDVLAAMERSEHATTQAVSDSESLGEAARFSVRRLTFGWFLLDWHQERIAGAEAIRANLPPDCREYLAATFLLDPSPLIDKIHLLQAPVVEEEPGFMQFVLGEQYLKNGEIAEAVEAYRRVAQIAQPGAPLSAGAWLSARAQDRLIVLEPREVPRTEPATSQTSREAPI